MLWSKNRAFGPKVGTKKSPFLRESFRACNTLRAPFMHYDLLTYVTFDYMCQNIVLLIYGSHKYKCVRRLYLW